MFQLTLASDTDSKVIKLIVSLLGDNKQLSITPGNSLSLAEGNKAHTEVVSIASRLCELFNELSPLAGPDMKKEILGFFDYAATLSPSLASNEAKILRPALAKLNKQIEPVVFLVNNRLSLADLVLFCHISSAVKKWTLEDIQSSDIHSNIFRWYDNIQHLIPIRDTIYDLDLFAIIKLPSIVISEQANAPSDQLSSITVPQSQPSKPPQKGSPEPQMVKKDQGASKKEEQAAKKEEHAAKKEEQAAKREEQAAKRKKNQPPPKPVEEVGFAKVDFRVGHITHCVKHPDADSLYMEQIDVGEGKPRNVISGLVKFVPLAEMQDRMVIVMLNIKPSVMRGETSQAMVMCASNYEHSIVELLIPPEGSVPGDRVFVDGEEGSVEPMINLKNDNNTFKSKIQPHLSTNDELQATYKGKPLHTDKGIIIARTLKNAHLS